MIGSIEQHKMADLVLWQPMFFGVKPEMIIKGGQVSWSQAGIGSYADLRPEPICLRKKFGAVGRSPNANSVVFVSKVCLEYCFSQLTMFTRRILKINSLFFQGMRRDKCFKFLWYL